jgi:hypothetical protein
MNTTASTTVLGFMDGHPAAACFIAACAVALGALGYACVRRVCAAAEAWARTRRGRPAGVALARGAHDAAKARPAAQPAKAILKSVPYDADLRGALTDLGYRKGEIDVALGKIDRSLPLVDAIREALKVMPRKRAEASA